MQEPVQIKNDVIPAPARVSYVFCHVSQGGLMRSMLWWSEVGAGIVLQ